MIAIFGVLVEERERLELLRNRYFEEIEKLLKGEIIKNQ